MFGADLMTKTIKTPYLLFLGDTTEPAAAKTAAGIAQWRPGDIVGQNRLPECTVDLGLDDLTFEQARDAGAKTMIIGIAPAGGQIPGNWIPTLAAALRAGLDLAAGLHKRLNDIPELRAIAEQEGRTLFDVRQPAQVFAVGTGIKRPGLRVLTVGTDCVVGKKYTALALERELRARGVKADFRATGQTGILISGRGVAVDAVIADFISGAAEWLSPAADDDHWDVVEGQGALAHPAYAGVTLGLIHGSQPDALVVCHEPVRKTLVGFTYPVPPLEKCIEQCVEAARLTNPACQAVGVSLNSARMNAEETAAAIEDIERRTGLPCEDPIKHGMRRIADNMLSLFAPEAA